MDLQFQQNALEKLKLINENNIHSIMLCGLSGIGKTYLAYEFSKMKGTATTFIKIDSRVQDIKECIYGSMQSTDTQVICIENLDKGSLAASQAILKYLEEPLSNVYIVVTCLSSKSVTSTIASRCYVLQLDIPRRRDLDDYAKSKNSSKFDLIKDMTVYKTCKTLSDIDLVMKLSLDQLRYYDSYSDGEFWNLSTDQILWNFTHFPDNSKCDPKRVIQVVMSSSPFHISTKALNALIDLDTRRYSESAVLGKFVIDIKCN